MLAFLAMSLLLEHNCVMVGTDELDPGLPGVGVTNAGSQIDRDLEGGLGGLSATASWITLAADAQ
jgi:hypothetical protein